MNAAQPTPESTEAIEAMHRVFQQQQKAFRAAPMPSAEHRIKALQHLKQALLEYQQPLISAINSDFGRRSADETLLAERKARLIALHPEEEREAVAELLALESEPTVKLLQENAYRELLLRQRINEAARAVMIVPRASASSSKSLE